MSQDHLDLLHSEARVLHPGPRVLRPADFTTFSGAAAPCTRAQLGVTLGLVLVLCILGSVWPYAVGLVLHGVLFVGFMAAATWRIAAAFLAPAPAKAVRLLGPPPRYTIIAPLYREAGMIDQLVEALEALDYPPERLQILLTLEADDTETLEAVRRPVMPPHFEVVIAPPGLPRTKPRACNVALEQATGEYLVIYDAEDRPHPGQLREAAARFAGMSRRVACLQAPLRIDPRRSFLGRQFALEYAIQFEIMIPVLARLKAPFPLGGTSNHFRIGPLRAIGGWDAFNVTEDADIGFQLAARGYRLGSLSLPTWEAPPETLQDWLPQRTRWIKGFMQTWGVHTRRPLSGGWRCFAALQITLGLSIVSSVLHGPILAWIAIQLALQHSGIGWSALTHADASVLTIGWFASAMAGFAGAKRAGFPVKATDLLLAPLYWPLLSLAAFRAMHQLIVKPFHWDKTNHQPCAGRDKGEAAIEQA